MAPLYLRLNLLGKSKKKRKKKTPADVRLPRNAKILLQLYSQYRSSRCPAEQSPRHRYRHSDRQTHCRDRAERIRKIEPRFPDALRRGPASLRRNFLPLHPAVLRPNGQTAGRCHSRHSSGDRHRATERRQDDTLHRRHDH